MNRPDTVQLLDYLRGVRRRWRLVALVTLIATGVALGISLSGEKQYDATADLLLRGEEPINTLFAPDNRFSSNDPERELNTEIELIKVAGTAHAVRRALGIERSTDALLAQVETESSNTSNIVSLTVRDPNPRLAAAIANAFAEAYVEFRVSSARERYQEAAALAQRQLEALDPGERGSSQGQALEARQRELEIAAALQTGGAEIVRRASVPASASRPRPVLAAVLGCLLGLLLGVIAALSLDLVDRRLKDEQEIEDFFGLRILAAIPRPTKRAVAGRVGDDLAQREAYGLLGANLRFSTLTGDSSVLMVTSAGPAEGKTSATLGIARALTRLGLRVIAVEADLRRPRFVEYTGARDSRGLTAVLSGGARMAEELVWLDADTLQQVDEDHAREGRAFAVLPAGPLPENPAHALSRPAMGSVLDVARALADVVLVDTAPIGTVNDATAIARSVDSIALVVRLNATTKDSGRRALRVLRSLNVNLAGIVLTDAGDSHRYGYYPSALPLEASPPAVESRDG